MTVRHVTTDEPIPAGPCAVCGNPVPPAPARGGRSRDYCSRACQQAAYRARQAARTPPADPASVGALLGAVRALGVVLDAGGTPEPAQVEAVRDETAALFARLGAERHVTTAAPTAPAGPDIAATPTRAAEPSSAPVGHHVTTDGPARLDWGAEAGQPVRVRGGRRLVALSMPASAAVRAVVEAKLTGETYAMIPDDYYSDGSAVMLCGVRLGAIRPTRVGASERRAWVPWGTDLRPVRQKPLRTRKDAADALVDHYRDLASRARPAVVPPIIT